MSYSQTIKKFIKKKKQKIKNSFKGIENEVV
jgi:hypothetical protein